MRIHDFKSVRFLAVLVLGAVGNLGETQGASTNVAIKNFTFVPKEVTIQVGDTVTWDQQDTTPHTSTSDQSPPAWDSGLLSKGQTFSFTFNSAGTFPYYCTPHRSNPNMHGSVTVLESVSNTNLPVVNITSPGKGALFLVPTSIELRATAVETNGGIDRVEFFAGTNSLGTSSQSPYGVIWSNVTAGVYELTAKASDTNGVSALSGVIPITVAEASVYIQHNLVSDLANQADHTDANLLNPWGISFNPTGPFWISDAHSGLSTIYDTTGAVQTLVVKIPVPAGATSPASPTGIVFNNTPDFLVESGQPARFIFATEEGVIAAWNNGSNAVLKADNSSKGAIYKGLALGRGGNQSLLYASDFHNGRIDVFDANFQPAALPGSFSDTNLPEGYAPFGLEMIGTNLYVTYARQDENKEDDVPGEGLGYINVFDASGNLIKRFASNSPLNAPWGLALAPQGFGKLSGALLVGNFGNGRIHAFDPDSGVPLGALTGTNGLPISIEGLWGLKFGNNARGGDGARLYFTAGISGGGEIEDHGLFGSISAQSAMEIRSITDQGSSLSINWVGGVGPYELQQKTTLSDSNWVSVLTTTNRTETVPKTSGNAVFRVRDNASIPGGSNTNGTLGGQNTP